MGREEQGRECAFCSTTAREIADLKRPLGPGRRAGTVVPCAGGAGEIRRWAERLLRGGGSAPPGRCARGSCRRAGAESARVEPVRSRRSRSVAGSRTAASRPRRSTRWRDARGAASTARWAAAVLARDAPASARRRPRWTPRASADRLVSGPSRSARIRRAGATGRSRTGAGGPRRAPDDRAGEARRALHAVYQADLALKRGAGQDPELRDFVEREIESGRHGRSCVRTREQGGPHDATRSVEDRERGPATRSGRWRSRARAKWNEIGLFTIADPKAAKRPFYCLNMFPYPSGDLHVGHGTQLHPGRRGHPAEAHAGARRPVADGLGRVRASRRERGHHEQGPARRRGPGRTSRA